jgi:hypothetical protein
MRSNVISAIVAGALIGFVGMLVLMRPHPSPVSQAATPAAASTVAPADAPLVRAPASASGAAVPPDAARSSALFERNHAMPSDPDLASEYEDLNLEYFGNMLPPPAVRWESGLADLGPMIAENFSVLGLTNGRMILLNPAVEHNPDQRRRALCHEMVHMAVWLQDDGHGPIFQERLRELSLRGAFKGIVATDQEKDDALAGLKAHRGTIDSDERALVADRAALDRTSQAAIDAYNARVSRHQADIAEYNRLIEQYNLMISYPDGLARERLQARADGTTAER